MKIGVSIMNRNDGYKDFKRGVTVFRSMLETFDEINYVDWNSPKGSFLWEIKDQIPQTGKIKHYVIPPSIVDLIIKDPKASKCNQSLSRNIAIRRSEADWIVSTNIDVIPPSREELEQFINEGNKDTFYTISRREAPLNIFDKYKAEEWKDFYKELCNTVPERAMGARVTPNDIYSIINSCGDFQVAHKDLWHKIKGFEESMIYALFEDSNVQKKAVLNGFGLKAALSPPLFHIEHAPYSTDETGQRMVSETFNNETAVNANNNPITYIDNFTETGNSEDWGLNNIKLECEII